MHCPNCGTDMYQTSENLESTCYTCFACPAHYVDTEPYDAARAIYLPMAGAECPYCSKMIPFDVVEFKDVFFPPDIYRREEFPA